MTTWHHGELPTPEEARFNLSSHVFESEDTGTQHVFYDSLGDNIYELWWRGSEAAHPNKLAPGRGLLTSYVNEDTRTQHVFYLDLLKGNHIWEISWGGGGPMSHGDLMPASDPRLIAAEDIPTSHLFRADGTNHVFYRTLNNHVAELAWRGDEVPRQRDLTVARNGVAPLADDGPSSYVFGDTQHVFYNSGGRIIELSWLGSSGDPIWRDLIATATGKAPQAVGRPTTHVFDFENTQHVFYVGDNGHIIELWWRPGEAPHPEDLTDQSGGAPLAVFGSLPVSHVFDFENTQHVFYVADNGHIREIWWEIGGAKRPEDLTKRSGAAPIHSDVLRLPISSHVFKKERTQHLFYVAAADNRLTVMELWSQP